ncbi:hypothetical protein Tco_0362956 [Tanacetum coccineum]
MPRFFIAYIKNHQLLPFTRASIQYKEMDLKNEINVVDVEVYPAAIPANINVVDVEVHPVAIPAPIGMTLLPSQDDVIVISSNDEYDEEEDIPTQTIKTQVQVIGRKRVYCLVDESESDEE